MSRRCGLIKINSFSSIIASLWLIVFLFSAKPVLADPAYWISLAEEKLGQGNREGALEAFQRASWEMPQDANLHYNMGVLSESLGRYADAVGHYLTYLRWNENADDQETVNNKVYILCGRLGAQAYKKQQYRKALDWYFKAKKLYPRAKAVYYNLSRVYQAMGDRNKVVTSLKEFLLHCNAAEKGPVKKQLAGLLFQEAEELFQKGNYLKALEGFQEIVRLDPAKFKDPRCILYQAQCEEKLGYLIKAEKHYSEYIRLDPVGSKTTGIQKRLVHIYLLQAKQYLLENNLKRAQTILNKGMKIDPDDVDLHLFFVEIYKKLKQPEQAVAHLEKILQLIPNGNYNYSHVESLVKLCLAIADAAYKEKHYRTALRFLKKAGKWDPKNTIVITNLANIYEVDQNWSRAIQTLKRYLALAPNAVNRHEIKAKLAYYYYVLGAKQYQNGDYHAAQKAFEQAILIRPEDPALLYNLSMVLLKRGQTNEALHFLERYLKYEKDPEEVEQVKEQIMILVNEMQHKSIQQQKMAASTGLIRTSSRQSGKGEKSDLYLRKKAFLLMQSGRWQEALSLYNKHIERFPADRLEEGLQKEVASVYRELGRAALMDGDLTKALETLNKAKEWSPTEAVSYLWEGSLYERVGKPQKALGVYKGSLRFVRGGEDRQAVLTKITGLLTYRLQNALLRNDLTQALDTMNTLEPYLAQDSTKDIHYQKARLEKALGHRSEAYIQYSLHLLNTPQALKDPSIREEILDLLLAGQESISLLADPHLAYQKGLTAVEKGDYPLSLFCFLLARSQNATFPDLTSLILKNLDSLDLNHEVLAFLSASDSHDDSTALSVSETEKEYYLKDSNEIIMDFYNKGLYEKGIEQIQKLQAMDLSKSQSKLASMQGVFEEKLGRDDEAISQYEYALNKKDTILFKDDEVLNNRFCVVLIRKALDEYNVKNFEKSLELLKKASRSGSGRKDIPFNLGCVYLQLKDLHNAHKAFSTFLELAEEDSPRKDLTRKAIVYLKRQLTRAPVVRYDSDGVALNLVFEKPLSLGQLLTNNDETNKFGKEQKDLLDEIFLAPYIERTMAKKDDKTFLP